MQPPDPILAITLDKTSESFRNYRRAVADYVEWKFPVPLSMKAKRDVFRAAPSGAIPSFHEVTIR